MARDWCGVGRDGGRHKSKAVEKLVHVEGHRVHGIVKTNKGLIEVAGGHEDKREHQLLRTEHKCNKLRVGFEAPEPAEEEEEEQRGVIF